MTSLWITDFTDVSHPVTSCYHCDAEITVAADEYPSECPNCHSHMNGVLEKPKNFVRLLRKHDPVVLEELNKPVPEMDDPGAFGRNGEFGDTGLGSTLRGNN